MCTALILYEKITVRENARFRGIASFSSRSTVQTKQSAFSKRELKFANPTHMTYSTTHRPFHLYLDHHIYFLTIRCLNAVPLFQNKRNLILQTVNGIVKKFQYGFYAWVVVNDHLHILLKVKTNFKRFIRVLNGRLSFEINTADKIRGRKNIYQYWDYCPKNEKEFYTFFNYIHHNPVKHKYCKNQTEVKDYRYSSYKQWIEEKGEEWIASCFESYPIRDFSIDGYD